MAGTLSFGAGSAMSELAALLMSTESTRTCCTHVVQLSVRAVDGATTGGATLGHDGRPHTAASADALTSELDERQYALDEGPCLQAMQLGEVVTVTDTATETRWGPYPAVLLENGVRSVPSTPLLAETKPIGVLNLYARAADSTTTTAGWPGYWPTSRPPPSRRCCVATTRRPPRRTGAWRSRRGPLSTRRSASSWRSGGAAPRTLSRGCVRSPSGGNVKLRAVAAEILDAVQHSP